MGNKWAAAGAGLGRLKKEERKMFGELENEEKERVCQMKVILFIPPIYSPNSSIIS